MRAQQNPDDLLTAQELSFRVNPRRTLVEGAGLAVSAGDIVAIVGPNGAGKSTFLRMLAGLLVPTTGSITLDGRPLSDYSAADRARSIAYVDQLDQPDRRLSVAEYVQLGRIPHTLNATREDNERAINDALKAVGLTDRTASRIGHLSGGELQRAILARALCQEPKLLFLDEPTNHLDPRAKGILLSLLLERRLTTICVLHDLALVPKLATHAVLMNEGRVVAFGKTDTVLTQDNVRRVFGIDVLHLAHPTEDRLLTVLDIPVSTPQSH
ncbi:MAG: ABC transporter ATP-binding protein [Pseudomonadota bacterium]